MKLVADTNVDLEMKECKVFSFIKLEGFSVAQEAAKYIEKNKMLLTLNE